MIRAEIVGNVGSQPEVRQAKSGKAMCKLRVASTKKVEGRDPVTTWVSVLCFDEQAHNVAERVNKGDRVLVTGRLEVETYQKDGVDRTDVMVMADDVGISLRFGAKKGQPTAANRGDAWEGDDAF